MQTGIHLPPPLTTTRTPEKLTSVGLLLKDWMPCLHGRGSKVASFYCEWQLSPSTFKPSIGHLRKTFRLYQYFYWCQHRYERARQNINCDDRQRSSADSIACDWLSARVIHIASKASHASTTPGHKLISSKSPLSRTVIVTLT